MNKSITEILTASVSMLNAKTSNSVQPVFLEKDLFDSIPDREIIFQGYTFKLFLKYDVIKEFLRLPGFVYFEGVEYELKLFNNSRTETRLVYSVYNVMDDSPHKQMWDEYGCIYNRLLDRNCSFLFLVEGITNENWFHLAILDTLKFLNKNSLLKP